MTDEIRNTTAEEDLAYIRRIMEETRRAVTLHGDYFIVWGTYVLIGLIGTWWLGHTTPPGWSWSALWGGLTIIAWLVTVWRVRTETHAQRVSTPIGRMLGAVWLACGIAIVLICFVGIPLGVTSIAAIGPTIAAIVGIGAFLTGTLMGTSWVRNLAFGWWAGAVAEFIWHGELQLLIGALLVVLFYIVPGVILNAQAGRTSTARRT